MVDFLSDRFNIKGKIMKAVCGNCGGSGRVWTEKGTKTCPVCKGSGRV